MLIYADESGDLGWSFNLPYGHGGSSRHLSIFAVTVPRGKEHHLERVMKHLYKASGWGHRREHKWVDCPSKSRMSFAAEAAKLATNHCDISYRAITVFKQAVRPHIREDENKLYNYMLNLLLTEHMAKHDRVTFIPDPRSIRVESGNSLHDYLQTELWFKHNAMTRLETIKQDSRHCKSIQFADMMAGIVQSHFEFNKSEYWQIVRPHVSLKKLYFPSSSGCVVAPS